MSAIVAVPPGRVPPYSLDAERSLLGGILLDNAALDEIRARLSPVDFYREAHRKIYEAMLALADKHEPVDRVTLKDSLKEQGSLEAVGGENFIDALDTVVPSAANQLFYANIIREKSLARQLIEAAHLIASEGYEDSKPVGELIDHADSLLCAIQDNATNRAAQLVPMRQIVRESFKTLEDRFSRHQAGETITGVASGLVALDRLTGGWQRGDFILGAGRPSMGKTSWAFGMAQHAAINHRQPGGKRCGVVAYSIEQPKEQIGDRALALEARVDLQNIRTGALIESDWARLARASGALADAPLWICDLPSISAHEVRAIARRHQRELSRTRWGNEAVELGLIVVDYLQLLRANESIDSREQQVSEMSRVLKATARELSVPLVALSQLNRALEKRPDKRPVMSDLRDSGSLEQDADVIAFLYREEVYEKEKEDVRGLAEIILGKQRNGPIGTASVAFLHPYTRFENLAVDHRAEMEKPKPRKERPRAGSDQEEPPHTAEDGR